MPAQLTVQFLDMPSDAALIVLMDSNNLVISAVDAAFTSEITTACSSAQFKGNMGNFSLYTSSWACACGW